MSLKELYELSAKEMAKVLPSGSIDFRLEEATFDQLSKQWNLVVSYLAKNRNNPVGQSALITPVVLDYERVYKKIVVSEQGEFLGFRIYSNK